MLYLASTRFNDHRLFDKSFFFLPEYQIQCVTLLHRISYIIMLGIVEKDHRDGKKKTKSKIMLLTEFDSIVYGLNNTSSVGKTKRNKKTTSVLLCSTDELFLNVD